MMMSNWLLLVANTYALVSSIVLVCEAKYPRFADPITLYLSQQDFAADCIKTDCPQLADGHLCPFLNTSSFLKESVDTATACLEQPICGLSLDPVPYWFHTCRGSYGYFGYSKAKFRSVTSQLTSEGLTSFVFSIFIPSLMYDFTKGFLCAELIGMANENFEYAIYATVTLKLQNQEPIEDNPPSAAYGILLTWNFLIYSTTLTIEVIIVVYSSVNILSYLSGFLCYDENSKHGIPNKQTVKLSKKFREFVKALSIFLASTATFYAIPVLLGAPLLSQCFETLHFAILMSTLLTFPGILTFGADENRWIRIVFGTGPQSRWELLWLRSGVFCLWGAWFGAFVIPLDWDAPWQIWPISCVYGSLIGYSLGLLYNLRPNSGHQHRKLI